MSRDDWGLYDHGFDKMPEVIQWALRHCLNQGTMVVAARGSAHCVLFRKFILRNGELGLSFGFPEAEWATPHLAALRDGLTAAGIVFREHSESYGAVRASIHVDCGREPRSTESRDRCWSALCPLR